MLSDGLLPYSVSSPVGKGGVDRRGAFPEQRQGLSCCLSLEGESELSNANSRRSPSLIYVLFTPRIPPSARD